MKIKINKGFTLVELLIVIGILSILSMAVLLTLNPFTQIQKGNDAKRKADLSQVQKALEIYYQDNNKYPVSTVDYQITGAAWGNSWQPYMNFIPSDPVPGKYYVYYTPDGQSYYLYASLDRGSKDPQVCSGDLCTGSGIDMTTKPCGSGNCDFGVSSPDKTP